MPKRRAKRTVKQSASSTSGNIDGAGPEDPKFEKEEDTFIDQDGMNFSPWLSDLFTAFLIESNFGNIFF